MSGITLKNLEEFLERIEASKILHEPDGLAKLTDAIIENLPAGETYPFFVWTKPLAYPLPDAYIRQYTKRLKEYFEEKNIHYPNVGFARVFPVELTSEQACELKSSTYVKKITPGLLHPGYTLCS